MSVLANVLVMWAFFKNQFIWLLFPHLVLSHLAAASSIEISSFAESRSCGSIGLFRVWVPRSKASSCERIRAQLALAHTLKSTKPHYDFIAEVNASSGLIEGITIVNTQPPDDSRDPYDDDETDFKKLRYRLSASENSSLNSAELSAYLRKFETFHLHKYDLKIMALLAGVSQSEHLVQKKNATGQMIVVDRKSGKEVSPSRAYEIFRDENVEHKHYLAAVLEAGAVLGLGTLAYNAVYSNEAPNTWRYHFNWESYRDKFSSKGVRFDDNWDVFNTVGHPLSGAIYYLMARSNGLSAMESFLYVFTISSVWEYLVEFRNAVGLNDMIFTPLTAFALGESMNQLSLLFERSSNTLAHRILAGIFGQPVLFNQWLHGNRPKTSASLNGMGIATDVWHRLDFYSAVGVRGSGGEAGAIEVNGSVGFDSRIVQIRDYQDAGSRTHVIWGPEITDLLVHSEWGRGGLDAFTLLTQVVYAGYYSQNISQSVSGVKSGIGFLVGASTGYELSTMHAAGAGGIDDMIGNVRVLGAVAEFDGYFRGAHLKFSLDFFGDFAAIHAFALNRYAAQSFSGLDGLRSVLRTQGYYYAGGVTTDAQVSLDYEGAEAGFNASYDTFRSIDGHDKNQEQATRDYPMTEQRLKTEAYLGYQFQGTPMKMRLVYRRIERSGTIQTDTSRVQDSAIEQSLQARVIVVF